MHKMNTELQIVCEPGRWHDCTFAVVGLRRGGREVMPKRRAVAELPEPWAGVWSAMVERLRGVAPGEWAAVYIAARRVEREVVPEEPRAAELVQGVKLTVHRVWDDGTTAAPFELLMEDAAAVAFFEYLTAEA